jgi:hypothetical protein
MSPELKAAIALVTAAGYRVSKPRAPKNPDRVGPSFVATWSTGEVTRMSTFTTLERPDLGRGVRLALAAYRSRLKRRLPPRPRIVECFFTQDGRTVPQDAAAANQHLR